MVGNPRFHRGRDSQSHVNAGEIVVHEMEGNRCLVVSKFLNIRLSAL